MDIDKEQIKQDILDDMSDNKMDNAFNTPIFSLCDSIRSIYDEAEIGSQEQEYLFNLGRKIHEYTKEIADDRKVYLEPDKDPLSNYYFCWPFDDLQSRIDWLNDNM